MHILQVVAIFAGLALNGVSAAFYVSSKRDYFLPLVVVGFLITMFAVISVDHRIDRLVADAFEKGRLEGGRVGVLDHREGEGFSGSPMHYVWFVKLSDGREVYKDVDVPFIQRHDGTNVVRVCFGELCRWKALALPPEPITDGPLEVR
ncbi:MAG TPA: hypothetical protein VI953_01995 [Candidatus Paceibacterota bacterium]